MSREDDNKQVLRRWFSEVWNGGNYAVAYELVDSKFRVHGAGGQVTEEGPEGLINLVRTWRDAFPDGHMTVDELIAEGDMVVARDTWRGTHRGEFYGVRPSGAFVTVTSIGMDRVVDGKIVEGWGELDMLGMMRQIGGIPAPPLNE